MRVWQVIPSITGGGAQKVVCMLQERINKRGLDSQVVSFVEDSSCNSRSMQMLGVSWPYNPLVIFRLCKLLRRAAKNGVAPDIIHTHLTPAQILTPLAVRLSGCPAVLVTTEHSTFNKRRKMFLGFIIDHLLYRPYAAIICISNGTRDALSAWQPTLLEKLTTILNGIDIDQFRDAADVGHDKKSIVIISVGRLVPLKNYETALKAIASLRDLKIEYQIVGAGHEENLLKQRVVDLKIEHCVKFLGWTDDVPSLLKRADIYLLTSSWEGFGLAVAEAMASGLPVVVSDLPGVREVVGSDGECAYLVNPTNVEAIASRLRRLICDPHERLIMGGCGKERVQQFSIDETARKYVELYKEIKPALQQ